MRRGDNPHEDPQSSASAFSGFPAPPSNSQPYPQHQGTQLYYQEQAQNQKFQQHQPQQLPEQAHGAVYSTNDDRPMWAAEPNADVNSNDPLAFPQPPAHTRREEYANAAIQSSAQHWVQEQARREMQRRTGETETGDATHDVPGSVHFIAGPPKYVFRITLLLAVGLFGAIPLMSSLALTVLLSGCVVTYIVDFAGYRRGCVLAVMATAGFFGFTLILSNLHALMSSVGPLSMILSVLGLLAFSAMAALLQFRWLQFTFPELICVMERCVMGVTPILTLPSLLSTVTALVGSRHAPAWFLLSMCVLHRLFFSPLDSSFLVRQRRVRQGSGKEHTTTHGGNDFGDNQESNAYPREHHTSHGHADQEMDQQPYTQPKHQREMVENNKTTPTTGMREDNNSNNESGELVPLRVNGRAEAMTFTILLVFLPAVLYMSFQSNWPDAWIANGLNTLGMLCVPLAYLCVEPSHSLWFLLPDEWTVRQRLEHDPFGVHETVGKYRQPLLVIGIFGAGHWAVYRVLHSRYRYLFNGFPPPFNGLFLVIAMYTGIFAVYKIKTLLDADDRGEKSTTSIHLQERGKVIAAAALSCTFVSAAVGLPGPFQILLLLCVSSLNLFLMDRLNAGPMMSFTIFSSLLLMWWMFRTFSFIVLDLHVLGESTTVPTPVVAVSVLWCYVLSCVAFTLSFSTSKVPFLITLFLHSLQVAWVEHVLYSQKEENVYPAVLVFLTSGVGVFLAVRLYKNEVLPISGASLIAASYVAKLPTFLVEVTGSYYLPESETESNRWFYAVEIGGIWWAALFTGYVATMFELTKGKQMARGTSKRLVALFVIGCLGMTLFTTRNLQRAAYEFITQSRLTGENSVHVLIGTFFIFFGLLTHPFFSRHGVPYAFLYRFRTLARGILTIGIILLITQPTRVSERDIVLEYDFINVDLSRFCFAAGFVFLSLALWIPMNFMPLPVRAATWLLVTGFLSVGLSLYLTPVPTVPLFAGVGGFVFFMILTIDMAHYRVMSSSEGWIIYGISICFLLFSLIVLGRVDVREYAKDNVLLMWEMYTMGRRRLLSVACVVNLFTAIILRFRLSGKSLLPRALPLTEQLFEQAGAVVNYAIILAVTSLSTLNLWMNGNDPSLHVASSLFFLLFVDDGILFTGLKTGLFRYFPPLAYTIAVLWASHLHNAYVTGLWGIDSFIKMMWALVYAMPVLPSHLSLLAFLWLGQKRGGIPLSVVLVFVALSVLCLLFTSDRTLQWMAIVSVCGQTARLLDVQFWKKRLETIL